MQPPKPPLADHLQPIGSGLVASVQSGALDHDRAADLDEQLRSLRAARAAAWLEIHP